MAEKYPEHLPIKYWAEDDRPREKLMRKGKSALSNAELLAILLGSGTKKYDALELARLILQTCNSNLIELSKMDHFKMSKIHGLGPAKSMIIEAALELGRRRQHAEALEKKQVLSSKDAYLLVKTKIEDLVHEEFWVLFLSRANKLVAIENFSKGGLTGTVADSRLIFQRALDWKCTGLILAHNHPSGSLQPSQQDIELTRKMKSAGQQLELNVLDHLIVTEDKYFSFADEGML
ncbi:MAG: DNA repair protein RadC [Saprospiraceae bacterium]|nr:DNA repair protein RadC [Saprospiraceae bacterium]